MPIPPIPTMTFHIADVHALTSSILAQAAGTLENASARYREAGYEVQAVRLSTRPIFDALADWSSSDLLNYVQELQRILDDVGLGYCSLGTVQAADPGFPLE